MQISWFRSSYSEVPDSCLDLLGSWLRSTHSEVPDSFSDQQRSLVLAHLLNSCSPVPAIVGSAAPGLLWPWSLAQFLLLWSSLPHACSCGVCCLSRDTCYLNVTSTLSCTQSLQSSYIVCTQNGGWSPVLEV